MIEPLAITDKRFEYLHTDKQKLDNDNEHEDCIMNVRTA